MSIHQKKREKQKSLANPEELARPFCNDLITKDNIFLCCYNNYDRQKIQTKNFKKRKSLANHKDLQYLSQQSTFHDKSFTLVTLLLDVIAI